MIATPTQVYNNALLIRFRLGYTCITYYLSYEFFVVNVVVLFRVITVYQDLKPFTQEINVSISVCVSIHNSVLTCPILFLAN